MTILNNLHSSIHVLGQSLGWVTVAVFMKTIDIALAPSFMDRFLLTLPKREVSEYFEQVCVSAFFPRSMPQMLFLEN